MLTLTFSLDPTLLRGVALVLALLGTVGLAMLLWPQPAPAPSEVAGRAGRHATTVHATACVLALAVAAGLDVLYADLRYRDTTSLILWVVVGTAWPLVVGLAYLGVHALGARRWPRPAGSLRRATLVPRADPTPRRLERLALGWVGLTVAALVARLAVATVGRGTRELHPVNHLVHALIAATAVALLVAARGVVAVVRDRISLDGPPDDDAAARRLSALRVLRGVQLILAATAALQFFAIGMIYFSGLYDGLESAAVGYACLVLAGLILLTGVVASLLPARSSRTAAPPAVRPADEPSAASDVAPTREVP